MFSQEVVYFTLRRTYTDIIIQSLGLQVAYNTNTPQGVRKWLCRLIALHLVPTIPLPGVFQAIKTQAPQLPQTTAMHDYILSTYTDTNYI